MKQYMNKWGKWGIGILTTLLTLSTQGYAQVPTGSPAPDFTLTDTAGTAHTLSDYAGKVVVLEWVNPDCPFIKKHYLSGNIPQLQKDYTQKGVIWLSIDSSAPGKEGNYPPQELGAAMTTLGSVASAVLIDEDGTVGKQYGAQTTPHVFIINAAGDVAYQGAIDSIAGTDPADIPAAENYVKKSLDEILAGKPVSTPQTKSYGCSVKY